MKRSFSYCGPKLWKKIMEYFAKQFKTHLKFLIKESY